MRIFKEVIECVSITIAKWECKTATGKKRVVVVVNRKLLGMLAFNL